MNYLFTYNYSNYRSYTSVLVESTYVSIQGEVTNSVKLKESFLTVDSAESLIGLMYGKYGPEFINHLEGQFCITLFDQQKKTLYLYRDRFGTIPCYYYHTDHFFAASTAIKSLMALPEIKSQLNPQAVADYISYGFVHAPNTLIQGVAQLLPGHFLTLTDDEVFLTEYYSRTQYFDDTIADKTIEQHAFHLDQLKPVLPEEAPIEAISQSAVDRNVLNEMVDQVDHPNAYSLFYLAAARQFREEKAVYSQVGASAAWGRGAVFDTLSGFQEHRWLLSYPKPIRTLISPLLSIPYKKELGPTYRQLILQDYYDLDYLYPTFYRRYPISALEEALSIDFKDRPKEIAQHTVVYQTKGFPFPYRSKVGMMEFSNAISNAQLSAIYNAFSLQLDKQVLTPHLAPKFQRYLSHVPDEVKVKLLQTQELEQEGVVTSALSLNVKGDEITSLLNQFAHRLKPNSTLVRDLMSGFASYPAEKQGALTNAIVLLELWLAKNKVDVS